MRKWGLVFSLHETTLNFEHEVRLEVHYRDLVVGFSFVGIMAEPIHAYQMVGEMCV